MLFVRRTAPEGSYFEDGDRASGVFGVLATGFSVLLGFIVFLAFASYDQSRSGRRDGGPRRLPAGRDGAVLPPATSRSVLTGELHLLRPVRRARRVGEHGSRHPGQHDQPVGRAAVPDAREGPADDGGGAVAYDKWLDQTSTREQARQDRIHGAVGVIPPPLWIVLFFIAGVIFVYMLFFADSGEGAFTQGVLMGSVTSVVVAMLLLVRCSSTARSTRASAVCVRWRWSGR